MSPPKFDDQPLHISDVPEGHLGSLTWEEAKMVAQHRYTRAGAPQDKLQAWLDDHQVYPKRQDPEARVMNLDWYQMLSLMATCGDWYREMREEENPYGSDLA